MWSVPYVGPKVSVVTGAEDHEDKGSVFVVDTRWDVTYGTLPNLVLDDLDGELTR